MNSGGAQMAGIAALREENETLRERLVQLEAALRRETDRPLFYDFGLSPSEMRILNLLLSRSVVSNAAFMDVLYGARSDPPSAKVIAVRICQMRRKLRPFGIEIETMSGWGYRLTPAMKARIRAIAVEE